MENKGKQKKKKLIQRFDREGMEMYKQKTNVSALEILKQKTLTIFSVSIKNNSRLCIFVLE